MKHKVFASLTADVVESTSLTVNDLKRLRGDLSETLQYLDGITGPVWGRIIRGDTIECVSENPNMILRFTLALKCYLKHWFSSVKASEAAKSFALRYSIGIGTMREVDTGSGFIDGPAVYISGRNLDDMPTNRYSAFGCETPYKEFADTVDLNISLLDYLINNLTAKQAIVVYYKLLRFPEISIAEMLGLSQPAVNTRAKLSQWSLINRSLEHFENIDFEDYVR